MMLYINGDSHSAAAESVTPYTVAKDDPSLFYLGCAPHPDNLASSWGKLLSQALRSAFRCDAENNTSNSRIIQVTREWLTGAGKRHPDLLIIIQWSIWQDPVQLEHDNIWLFHQDLKDRNIRHIFVNGIQDFSKIVDQKDWGTSYIGPYDPDKTYRSQVQTAGFETVAPDSAHFGKDAQVWWFKHLLDYIIKNKFI
jgi:hypothetical protein